MDNDFPQKKGEARKHKFSDFFYNRITYCGVFLAVVITILEVFLIGVEFLNHGANVYLGIFTFLVLPVFLILGLILIPVGALWRRRCVIKNATSAQPKTLFIDPSLPSHRNAIFVFLVGTTIFLILTIIGSYKAYHYTESVHFCGIMCHGVMEPEYTTYVNSPHARVKCVDCHIGPGADWYVKSKMSGARQVFATLNNSYSRPLETPVANLRPSKDTCEQCHWPGKFYSSVELHKTYYSTEQEEIPKWLMRMLVHVGRHEEDDVGEGIHAHMYINNDIYYVAEDEQRQEISWIKSVDRQGTETIYTSPDSPYKEKHPPPEKVRLMDCIDCHNRPTHNFHPPNKLLNQAMVKGEIDGSLPAIKEKAMALLSEDYTSVEEAEEKIRQELNTHYQQLFKDDYGEQKENVNNSIGQVLKMYRENFFPKMKVRWDTHPDNLSHINSPGCFRCHDGEHASVQGKVIRKDCHICHTIIEQGPPGDLERNTQGLDFRHPFEDDGLWQDMNCFDCHTGN